MFIGLYLGLLFLARCHGEIILSCNNINKSIRIEREITRGRVKRLFYGFLNRKAVVLGYPYDKAMVDDFEHGLEMLISFQGSGFVTELTGFCKDRDALKRDIIG